MNGKYLLTGIVSLIALLFAASLAVAAVATTTGTVERVEMDKGHFVLQTEDGRAMTLSATPNMLKGLKVGDEVEVDVEDGRIAKAIRDDEDAEKQQSSKPDEGEADSSSGGGSSGGTDSQ